jgi:uncharacterized membrane protein
MKNTADDYFSAEEKDLIVNAIKEAELNTSGEIRVHIELRCAGDAKKRAISWFHNLGMDKTEQQNGVLVYLAIHSKKFAIIGDKGIDAVVPDDFWESVKDKMLVQFKESKFAEGLKEGILLAGEQLKTYFPYQSDDVNELPDEISFS